MDLTDQKSPAGFKVDALDVGHGLLRYTVSLTITTPRISTCLLFGLCVCCNCVYCTYVPAAHVYIYCIYGSLDCASGSRRRVRTLTLNFAGGFPDCVAIPRFNSLSSRNARWRLGR